MAIERTLVVIKPDGKKRKLTGLAIDRLEQSDLEMIAAKIVKVDRQLARQHYAALKEKPFFETLIKFFIGEFHGFKTCRLLAMIYQGEDAIAKVRKIVGATNPQEADPRSIRGSFGKINPENGNIENVIHASANIEDAKREISLWFGTDNIDG